MKFLKIIKSNIYFLFFLFLMKNYKSNLKQFQLIDLGDNQLSEVVPMELGKLTHLRWLNLQEQSTD
jgi:Leucine-rich repeat (LRR) protein